MFNEPELLVRFAFFSSITFTFTSTSSASASTSFYFYFSIFGVAISIYYRNEFALIGLISDIVLKDALHHAGANPRNSHSYSSSANLKICLKAGPVPI